MFYPDDIFEGFQLVVRPSTYTDGTERDPELTTELNFNGKLLNPIILDFGINQSIQEIGEIVHLRSLTKEARWFVVGHVQKLNRFPLLVQSIRNGTVVLFGAKDSKIFTSGAWCDSDWTLPDFIVDKIVDLEVDRTGSHYRAIDPALQNLDWVEFHLRTAPDFEV